MADNENQSGQTAQETGQADTEDKLQCNVSVTDSGSWKRKIAVEIPRTEIDKELNKQYRELMRTAEVPGFRKGRSPRRLVEKRYGEDISEQTKLRLLAQAFEQIDKEQDFEILGEPDLDPADIKLPDQGDLSFEYEVEVKPEFKLPELEGIRVEKPVFEITPERIDAAIQQICRRHGEIEEVADGAAQKDDMVTVDVTMKVEGIEQAEQGEGHLVRVASTALMGVMIEDMEDVLSGAKLDDTRNCSGVVPDTHENEEYRGKKAEFTLKIGKISRMKPAELNEELFEKLGVANKDDLEKQVENSMDMQADREVRNLMVQNVHKYFDENIKFELPAGVVARYANRVLARRYYELLNEGIPREEIDENIEKLRAASSQQAAQQLKMTFIMDQVAEKLAIEVNDAEVNGFIARIAAMQERRPERMREEMERQGRLDDLRNQIRDDKAMDEILGMAQVVDAPPAQEQEEQKQQKKPKKQKKQKEQKKQEGQGKQKEQKEQKEQEEQEEQEGQEEQKTGKKAKTSQKTDRKNVKRKAPSSDS